MSEIAKHWIDGEWTSSRTVSESVNPLPARCSASGPTAARPRPGPAIAAARRAFETTPWSRDRSPVRAR